MTDISSWIYNILESQGKSKSKRVISMRISDIIEQFLLEMLDEDSAIEIQRNDLASRFNCAPSQITYVLDTRFTGQRGYIVESRRGGGGSIRIKRVYVDKGNYLMHVVNSIGGSVSYQTVLTFLDNMVGNKIITEREARLMSVALSDKYISSLQIAKNIVRAELFKNMLVSLIDNN